jgi:hypothetical protein
MNMTILNHDLVRIAIQVSPIVLSLIVYWLSSFLWSDHSRYLRYWLTICNLLICSLLLGLPSVWSNQNHSLGIQIIYVFILVSLVQTAIVICTAFYKSFQALPESRLYFRGMQLSKSIAVSFIIALFVFFSMPTVSFAATSLAVGLSFSGSVLFSHGLDRVYEDRRYIRHLLMLGLRDTLRDKPLIHHQRINDGSLQYIVSGLRLLYQPLETVSVAYNSSQIHLSNTFRMQEPIDVFSSPPIGWIHGTLAHKSLLESENHRLYSFVRGASVSMSRLVGSTLPMKIEDSPIEVNNFDSMLDHNLNNNIVRNKIDLISFSPKLFEAFSILGNWTADSGPLFITGPSGSGRRTLAHATLKKIGCKDVLLFDASSIQDEFSLVNNLEELFEGRSYTGAVIANAETLPKNSWDLIQSILKREHVTYAIALIGDESILKYAQQENVTVVRLTPLHERIEDLFFQTIYFSRQACRELGVTDLVIDYQAIQELLRSEFPENSRTLRNLCFDAVRTVKNKKITSFIHGSGKQLRSSMI